MAGFYASLISALSGLHSYSAQKYHVFTLQRRSEIRTLLQLGGPIMVAQLAQTSMGFVDTLMAGRYSAQDLAAVALGGSIWLPLYLACQGVLMATTPLVANKVGGNNSASTAHTFHKGLCVATLLALLSILILLNAGVILQIMDVSGPLHQKTTDYLDAIAWGFPAFMLYQVVRSYSEGFGKTRPVMKIAILGLLANIPLNYIFIYGKLGLPEMGAEGCGWATALVMWIMLLTGLLYLDSSAELRNFQLIRSFNRPRLQETLQFLKLGIPIGIALLIEASMFSVIALLLADKGEQVIAAHQITLSFTGLSFMIPLSIAMAITIRVGQLQGAGDGEGARYAAYTGIGMTLACAVVSSGFMLGVPEFITGWYTTEPDLIQAAASLVMIAALFQFSDAIQVSCAGALRGYKDTFIPLTMVFCAYWVVGLPTGILLGRTSLLAPEMGAAGFWIALVIGLTIGAILLLYRLRIIAERHLCQNVSMS